MALRRRDGLFEVGMVVLDVAAPILLLVGLRRTTAANVSLLNNFEIVATSLIVWTLFGERISRRSWGPACRSSSSRKGLPESSPPHSS